MPVYTVDYMAELFGITEGVRKMEITPREGERVAQVFEPSRDETDIIAAITAYMAPWGGYFTESNHAYATPAFKTAVHAVGQLWDADAWPSEAVALQWTRLMQCVKVLPRQSGFTKLYHQNRYILGGGNSFSAAYSQWGDQPEIRYTQLAPLYPGPSSSHSFGWTPFLTGSFRGGNTFSYAATWPLANGDGYAVPSGLYVLFVDDSSAYEQIADYSPARYYVNLGTGTGVTASCGTKPSYISGPIGAPPGGEVINYQSTAFPCSDSPNGVITSGFAVGQVTVFRPSLVYCSKPPRPWIGQGAWEVQLRSGYELDNAGIFPQDFAVLRAKVAAELATGRYPDIVAWVQQFIPLVEPASWMWQELPLLPPWTGRIEMRVHDRVAYFRGTAHYDFRWDSRVMPMAQVPDWMQPRRAPSVISDASPPIQETFLLPAHHADGSPCAVGISPIYSFDNSRYLQVKATEAGQGVNKDVIIEGGAAWPVAAYAGRIP